MVRKIIQPKSEGKNKANDQPLRKKTEKNLNFQTRILWKKVSGGLM